MGFSNYSTTDRAVRTTAFKAQPIDEKFVQQRKHRAHDEMSPCNVDLRVCHDSVEHPNTVPIQLYLDVTGSMGHIPNQICDEGLPHLIGKLLQNGVPDVALMFGAIGDHECDNYPLQVAQFESGDEEMDMWLTRVYLEGHGGGNRGESYALAWYFAANHVQTDAFDKRGKKGFLFTIGDEPFLENYPAHAITGIMGSTSRAQSTLKAAELYEAACVQNNVFHIFVEHGSRRVDKDWTKLLQQNCLVINDYRLIPELISKTILANLDHSIQEDSTNVEEPPVPSTNGTVEEML
jgi:hypothetical protein